MFFRSGDRASSLAAVLAAAAGRSAVSTAGVSGLSNDGGMGGEDGADAFRISMRSAICFQPGLDVGISELVVGAVIHEFADDRLPTRRPARHADLRVRE